MEEPAENPFEAPATAGWLGPAFDWLELIKQIAICAAISSLLIRMTLVRICQYKSRQREFGWYLELSGTVVPWVVVISCLTIGLIYLYRRMGEKAGESEFVKRY